MTQELLEKHFGNSWYEHLKIYLESKEFSNLGKQIATLRLTKTIYPSKELVFKAFKETPYDKVKVVFYGNEPYSNGSCDGLAYSNRNSAITNTLECILDEVDTQYPEWKDNIDYGRLDKQDLTRWTKQGVLLLNCALTSEKSKINSHIKYWESFIEIIIKSLNFKQDIIHCFYGNLSQKYAKFATNSSHTIIVNNSKIKVFKEINNELLARNLKEIEW